MRFGGRAATNGEPARISKASSPLPFLDRGSAAKTLIAPTTRRHNTACLFQALRYWGRRDLLPFYFRLRAFSNQRAQLSRSLEQATIPPATQATHGRREKRRRSVTEECASGDGKEETDAHHLTPKGGRIYTNPYPLAPIGTNLRCININL